MIIAINLYILILELQSIMLIYHLQIAKLKQKLYLFFDRGVPHVILEWLVKVIAMNIFEWFLFWCQTEGTFESG